MSRRSGNSARPAGRYGIFGLLVALAMTAARPTPAAWSPEGNPMSTGVIVLEARAFNDGQSGLYSIALTGGEDTLRVNHIRSDGTREPGWTVGGRALPLPAPYVQYAWMGLSHDGGGGCFVLDVRQPVAYEQKSLWIRRLTGNGDVAASWPADGIAVTPGLVTHGLHHLTGVCPGDMGEVYVTWAEVPGDSTGDYETRAQKIDAAGNRLWGASGRLVSPDDSTPHDIRSDGAGGVYVLYERRRVPPNPANEPRLRLIRLDGSGNPAPGWPADGILVRETLCPVPNFHATLSPDPAGGVIVTWSGWDCADSRFKGFASRVSSSGTLFPGWIVGGNLVASGATNHQPDHAVPDLTGGFLIPVYTGLGAIHGDSELRLQRVTSSGSPLSGSNGSLIEEIDEFSQPAFIQAIPSGSMMIWNRMSSGLPSAFPRVRLQEFRAGGVTVHPPDGIEIAPSHGSSAVIGLVPSGAGAIALILADPGAGDLYAVHVAPLPNVRADDTLQEWTTPLVPRGTDDATYMGVVLPPRLPGNIDSTWVNWNVTADGPGNLPAFRNALRLDGEDVGSFLVGANSTTPSSYASFNSPRLTVRGGRHTLEQTADADGEIMESTEIDNSWIDQWVWEPLATARGVGTARAVPPVPGIFVHPSADGLAFTRDPNYAWVTALAPFNFGDDYDLNVYDDYFGSLSGFSNLLAASLAGGNLTDFVVGHFSGTPTTVYPAAVRYDVGGGAGPFVTDQTDALDRNALDTGSFENQALGSRRVADVYEAYLAIGQTVQFTLNRNSGASDLLLEVFPPTAGGVHRRGNGSGSDVSTYNFDVLTFTATGTGWHPIVVYRNDGTNAQADCLYSLYWSPEVSDAGPAGGAPRVTGFVPPRPNPMRASTTLSWSLAADSPVRLQIFDVNGRRVRGLVDDLREAGHHGVTWDGTDDHGAPVASGLYLARFAAGDHVEVRRIVLAR